MLSRLSIRDILLIERLDLEFGSGLNVLTGETGAGKSILLDCLGFVLGWRGRANIVRKNADQGEVEAVFTLSKAQATRAILEEAGIKAEDDLILRRIVGADGRKRGFVNDRSVSGELLRSLGESLLEMHGQHDDKGLLNEREHLALLDRFAGVDLGEMRKLQSAYNQAKREEAAYLEEREAAKREADFTRHAAEELTKLGAQAGEEFALDEKRRLMQQGEKRAGDINALLQLLGHEGVGERLSNLLRRAQDLAAKLGAPMDEPLGGIERAVDQLANAEAAIARLAEEMEFDPLVLEATEERLFAIRAAARKYQVEPDALADEAARFQSQIEALDDGDKKGAELAVNVKAAQAAALSEAERISQARKKAAKKLDGEIFAELEPLKLENARFMTEFETQELSANGLDRVRFVVQTNPGAPAGALSKIASGGELSRFLLALKLCLHKDEERSMIFDEIDRGVGGQTADAVGRRLRRLANDAQLLVVTHSPQVAAMGHQHFRVAKSQSKEDSRTEVEALGQQSRLHEIARMLSGDRVTAEALAAAEKLVEAANG